MHSRKKKSIPSYYIPSGVVNLILEKTVPINNDVHARSGFQIFIVTNNEADFFIYLFFNMWKYWLQW